MIIYLSGAITGTSDAEKRFREHEKILKKWGHKVLNPQKILEPLTGVCDSNTIINVCGRMIDLCDGIALIPGWEKSLGTHWEIGYAVGKGLPVYEIDLVCYLRKIPACNFRLEEKNEN